MGDDLMVEHGKTTPAFGPLLVATSLLCMPTGCQCPGWMSARATGSVCARVERSGGKVAPHEPGPSHDVM